MPGTVSRKGLATATARAGTIALIAMVIPTGIDISSDGVVSFGAPISQAANIGTGASHDADGGSNSGTNSTGAPGAGDSASPSAPDPTASQSADFSGNAEPAAPDLSTSQEQRLISRGWDSGRPARGTL